MKKNITPKKIVNKLNKKIIGQHEAKKAIAIALYNRYNRQKLLKSLNIDIIPKNILLIGPTGVGKTEIARTLSEIVNAPFIKIEATKFTEVGYVGRDVEAIIRDLVNINFKKIYNDEIKKKKKIAKKKAQKKTLKIFLSVYKFKKKKEREKILNFNFLEKKYDLKSLKKFFFKLLLKGELNNIKINFNFFNVFSNNNILFQSNIIDITDQIQSIFPEINSQKKNNKIKIKEIINLLTEEELSKLINLEKIKIKTIHDIENNGIVFLDEIDKIASNNNNNNNDVSRSGVQRDLLSLIEGTSINTKYGIVNTDHILFIGSGAFHLNKPTDLLPELQGRFPIKVKLKPLSVKNFIQILTNTKNSLLIQYKNLLKLEGLNINFTKNSIKQIAKITFFINYKTENIGARRLYTVIEKLLEELFFLSKNINKKYININKHYVDFKLNNLIKKKNLYKYII